jgi:hypothetical protein
MGSKGGAWFVPEGGPLPDPLWCVNCTLGCARLPSPADRIGTARSPPRASGAAPPSDYPTAGLSIDVARAAAAKAVGIPRR